MILAVMNNKGGVLKSSISTSLAGIYAREGKRVLLVDMDNQGNSSIAFGANPDQWENTVYDVLMGDVDTFEAIYRIEENIDILPANHMLTFFELDVLTQKGAKGIFYYLKYALKQIENQYDAILIDSPPNSGIVQGNILTFAEEVLVPFQPEPFAMRSLVKIIEACEDFRTYNDTLTIAGVVLTLVDWRTRLHKDIMKECEGFCDSKDIKVMKTKIPRTITYSNALAYEQKPVTIAKPKSKLSKLYHALGKELEHE